MHKTYFEEETRLKEIICPSCGGSGGADYPLYCPQCRGRGTITVEEYAPEEYEKEYDND